MITAQVESFQPFLDEVKPLLPLHYEELALNKDKVPLDPNYVEYHRKDAEGKILVVTLRQEGKLVGYFVGFIDWGLHYKTCLTYIMDIFYVHPDSRGQGGGKIMIQFLENELRRRGVHRSYMGSKCHKEAAWLFRSEGYVDADLFLSKWLGE